MFHGDCVEVLGRPTQKGSDRSVEHLFSSPVPDMPGVIHIRSENTRHCERYISQLSVPKVAGPLTFRVKQHQFSGRANMIIIH